VGAGRIAQLGIEARRTLIGTRALFNFCKHDSSLQLLCMTQEIARALASSSSIDDDDDDDDEMKTHECEVFCHNAIGGGSAYRRSSTFLMTSPCSPSIS
jgi:hypothetical protein